MTAILHAIRDLDAQHKRGELDAGEYVVRRSQLLHSVEEANTEFVEVADTRPARGPHGNTTSAIGLGFVVCLCVMSLCIVATLLLVPDLNLALLLGVTILAVLAVTLLHDPET